MVGYLELADANCEMPPHVTTGCLSPAGMHVPGGRPIDCLPYFHRFSICLQRLLLSGLVLIDIQTMSDAKVRHPYISSLSSANTCVPAERWSFAAISIFRRFKEEWLDPPGIWD